MIKLLSTSVITLQTDDERHIIKYVKSCIITGGKNNCDVL